MKTLFLTILFGVIAWGSSLAQDKTVTVVRTTIPPLTDTLAFRAFVRAADTLKVRAERRIAALTGELQALDNALKAGKKLATYDEQQRQQLLDELSIAQGKLDEANRVLDRCWGKLPRRYRSLTSLYGAIDQYAADLKRRGGRLLVIGVAIGSVGTFLLLR